MIAAIRPNASPIPNNHLKSRKNFARRDGFCGASSVEIGEIVSVIGRII
jgi:hypothetical protein